MMILFRRVYELLKSSVAFPVLMEASRQERFEQRCRVLALELWAGEINTSEFEISMRQLLASGLESAWLRGMKDMGIRPSEMDPGERQELTLSILEQQDHVPSYARWIEAHNKANVGDRDSVIYRAGAWSKLYDDFRMRARVMAGGNRKLEWVHGPTEHWCKRCNSLTGKVKRAKYWLASGLHPQDPPNPHLDCGGWRCLCRLVPTDKPCSPGKLPGEGR